MGISQQNAVVISFFFGYIWLMGISMIVFESALDCTVRILKTLKFFEIQKMKWTIFLFRFVHPINKLSVLIKKVHYIGETILSTSNLFRLKQLFLLS